MPAAKKEAKPLRKPVIKRSEPKQVKQKPQEGLNLARYGEIVTPLEPIFPYTPDASLCPIPELPDPMGFAKKAIEALGLLKVPDGRNAGKPLSACLMEYQKRLITALYGYVDPVTLTRIINWVLLYIPRKNAKTSTAAFIAFLEMISAREENAEIICCASTVQQGEILFNALRKFIESSPIAHLFKLQAHLRKITFMAPASMGGFTAVVKVIATSNPGSMHGLSGSTVIVDEIHALLGDSGQRAFSALTTGSGARKNPRFILLTTAPDVTSALSQGQLFAEIYARAKGILSAKIDDRRALPIMYEATPEDDAFDSQVWRKCNPGIDGGILTLQDFEDMATKAKESQYRETAFRTLNLNSLPKHIGGASWLNEDEIESIRGEVSWEDLAECEFVICGADLAVKDDICSFVFVGFFDNRESIIAKTISFISGEAVEKYAPDCPELRDFVERGDLIVVPESGVDLQMATAEALDFAAKFEGRFLGFAIDPAMSALVTAQIEANDYKVYHIRQGSLSMNPAVSRIEGYISAGRMTVDDGLLPFCFANAVIIPRGEARTIGKPGTGYSAKKIDAAIAVLNAIVLDLSGEAAPQEVDVDSMIG